MTKFIWKGLLCLTFSIYLLNGCKKDDPHSTPDPSPISDTFYVSATTDSLSFLISTKDSGSQNFYITSGGGGNYPEYEVGVGTQFNSDLIFTIYFFQTSNKLNLSSKEQDALFTLGSHPFGSNSFSATGYRKGIIIEYYDGFKSWSSQYGIADQTGSSFIITKHLFNPDHNINASLRITEGNFNCKLYDFNGNVLILTNGKFRGQTVEKP